MAEQVLVVPRELLFSGQAPHGFVPIDLDARRSTGWLEAIRVHGRFASRAEVEHDPSRKQIIPYAVVVGRGHMLLLRRLDGGGERRLHHLYSVAVGGHLNPSDAHEGDPLATGARRELLEEVAIGRGSMGIIGFVNDETNPVGSVHFGVVFRVEVEGRDPTSREPTELEASFLPIKDVLGRFRLDHASFETWSRLVLGDWERVARVQPPSTCAVP